MAENIEKQSVESIKGVGTKTAATLEQEGYGEILGLAKAEARELAEETTLGEGKASKIIQKARNKLRGGNSFKDGAEIEKEQEKIMNITTGSEKLDGILKGGVPTNYTTEAYGQFSSGKTQLAHQLAVNCQLPEDEGGLDQKVIFIDTEETFMTDRIKQMAEGVGLDPQETLQNIMVARPEDSDDQLAITEEIRTNFDVENFGLIVVDSIMATFRAEYSGRGELTERQNKLGDHLKELRKLASAYDLAVFYTNQAYSDPDQHFGDPTNPTGGLVLGHSSSFRIYMGDRGSKGWNAELVDSPNLPQEDCMFEITNEGIRDTE